MALRVRDGSVAWKTYTISTSAVPTGKTSIGTPTLGPVRRGVWGTPTLDLKRRRLYITTGNNYSPPATSTSDSVMALRPRHGRHRLVEASALQRCLQLGVLGGAHGTDVPGGERSGLRLRIAGDSGEHDGWPRAAAGRAEVRCGVGLRSGQERRGDVGDARRPGRHQRRRAMGHGERRRAGLRGGIRCARHEDGHGADSRPESRWWSHGAQDSDGSTVWRAAPIPCTDRPNCSPAQSAALTALPGVVFSGSLDGHLRAYSTRDGTVLWDVDTIRSYDTVNGVKASGGAIDGPGAVVVGGMVFVNSGYSRFGGQPGNVLLAFALP